MRAVAWQFMNSHVGHSRARWSAIEVRWPALLGAPSRLTTGPAERAEPFTRLGAPSRFATGRAERAESFTLLGRPSAPTNLTTEHASRKESRARRPTGRAECAEPATPQNYRSRELFKRENGAVLSLLKPAAAVTHLLSSNRPCSGLGLGIGDVSLVISD